MSTKKDKFSKEDQNFMSIAINLASARRGLTGKNPSVGCVIVKNNEIISIGQTGYNGRPHAETNAIKNSLQSLQGSKMYVTLEPCSHYGKTPPCTNSIIKSGINEVFYSINDVDNRVKGKSFKILKKQKIKVKKNLLKDKAKELYRSYIVNKKYKLPFVTAKIAVSSNKLIYSEIKKKITNLHSDKLSHYLRFKNDAILITSKTLNIDDPRLNCRLKGYEDFSPKRIIIDRKLKIDLNTYIFKSARKKNTIIFYNSNNNPKIQILKKKGILTIKTKLDYNKKIDLKSVMKKLFSLGVRNLLVEGGDEITKYMLKKKLINEFYLFKSPKILPTNKNHVVFSSNKILKNNYKIKSKISSNLAKDTITIYKRQYV